MIAVEKQPHTAPIFVERCPVHHQLVAFDGEHQILGRCSGCANDASLAQRNIERGRL